MNINISFLIWVSCLKLRWLIDGLETKEFFFFFLPKEIYLVFFLMHRCAILVSANCQMYAQYKKWGVSTILIILKNSGWILNFTHEFRTVVFGTRRLEKRVFFQYFVLTYDFFLFFILHFIFIYSFFLFIEDSAYNVY